MNAEQQAKHDEVMAIVRKYYKPNYGETILGYTELSAAIAQLCAKADSAEQEECICPEAYTHHHCPLHGLKAIANIPSKDSAEQMPAQIIADANRYQYLKANAFNASRNGFDGKYICWTLEISAANEPGDNDNLDAAISLDRKYLNWKEPYAAPLKVER
jgi:hypothetical protein